MYFDYGANLDSQIFQFLVAQPFSSVKQLHSAISHSDEGPTLQAVYKAVHKLRLSGAVLKIGKQYCLSLNWLAALKSLAQDAAERLSQSPVITAGPEKGRRTWRLYDLREAKELWSQLILTLTHRLQKRVILSWNPHPLFYLVHRQHEEQMLATMQAEGIRMFKIVGGRTPLDHWAAQFWKRPFVEYAFAESPFEEERTVYRTVINDHVLTLKIGTEIASTIDQLYETSTRERKIKPASFLNIVPLGISITLALEQNEKLARSHWKKFENFFDVPLLA